MLPFEWPDQTNGDLEGWLYNITLWHLLPEVLRTSITLGIVDELAVTPQSTSQLARTLGLDLRPLETLVVLLTAAQVVTADTNHVLRLTDVGNGLVRKDPFGVREVILATDAAWHWANPDLWRQLPDLVRGTSTSAFESIHGRALFEAMDASLALQTSFHTFMDARSAATSSALVAAIADLIAGRTVVDVGGGSGAFARSLLKAHPDSRVTVYDRPSVVAANREQVFPGLSWSEGDFLRSVPDGAEVYMLKQVLHNWTDHEVVDILSMCRAAMCGSAAKLLVLESIEVDERPSTALLSLGMSLVFGGRQRTAADYSDLCSQAGLTVQEIRRTTHASLSCVVLVKPPPTDSVSA